MPASRRRPQDVPVWRARLNLGMATNQRDVVQQALKQLPAERVNIGRGPSAGSWLVRRRAIIAIGTQATGTFGHGGSR